MKFMKVAQISLLTLFLVYFHSFLNAQVPQGFNYQAALRNAAGEVAANASASLRMSIHQNTFDGNVVYQETHNTTTSQFGLVNLIIGEGTPNEGVFNEVQWNAASPFFMQVEVDLGDGFVDIGSLQLMSVPFAMASKKATDVMLDELNDVNTSGASIGQTLKWDGTNWIPSADNGSAYEAGNGITISGNIIINSGDASATNEIQSLSLSGTNLTLSNGGGSVTLPAGTTYSEGSGIDIVGNTISANDISATNEIQSLSLSGSTVSLSNGGGSITIPDASATNEIQSLSLSGTNLILSNGGGSVTLPTGTTYTEGSGIDIVGNAISAIDASATNEIQSLSLSGTNLILSNGGGSVTLPTGTTYIEGSGIDIVGNTISANDASATNEIQSLTLNGTNLTLSNGGGSVTLPTGTTYIEGSGIDIVGNTISANDISSTNEIQSLSLSGSTVSISNGGGSITIPDASATNEIQSLSLSGTNLTLSNGGGSVTLPTGTTYTAGTGISISGNSISNTGDTDATNDLTTSTVHGGDITGLYNNLQIASNSVGSAEIANGAISSSELSQMGATTGQILQWDGTAWSPETLASSSDGIWSTDATNAWRLNGNIGLGISTPSTGFHMHNKSGIRLSKTFTGSTILDGFYLGHDGFSNGNVFFTNYENADIIFNTNLGERMRILGNGNIGIGTSIPVAPLHLANLNASSDMFLKWSVLQTGHTATDGSQMGLNSTGQLVIDQKENQDIQMKRNGSTKLTVNSTGVDINGELTADDVTAGNVAATGAQITVIDAAITNTEALYLNSANGTGNRPVFANSAGQLYADNSYASTHYVSYPGNEFNFYSSSFAQMELTYNESPAQSYNTVISQNEYTDAFCAIVLPENAVITSLSAGFYDAMPNGGLSVILTRADIFGTTESTMASVSSNGSGGNQTVTSNSISNPNIDMASYTYYLHLTDTGFDDPIGNDEWYKLYGVRIAYTLE